MARIITTQDPTRDVRRYLRHHAHEDFALEHISSRHPSLPTAQLRRKARDVSFAIRQGLEYLESADGSSLLTRALPLFYAAENVMKALAIFKEGPLNASSFRVHGLSGDRKKRYSAKNLRCRVRSPGTDVWSRVSRVGNGDRLRVSRVQDNIGLTTDWWNDHGPLRAPAGTEIVLGELLRRLPELIDDVIFARWNNSYMVHVPNYQIVQTTVATLETSMSVTLRHGHHGPTRSMIVAAERNRFLLKPWTRTHDQLDVLRYEAVFPTSGWTGPSLRLDVFGECYMEFKARPLGELAIYFAALFILSDVVRYQPEQWKRLLDDHPSEAILIERFLDVASRKLPNLVLNELGGEIYEFRFAR